VEEVVEKPEKKAEAKPPVPEPQPESKKPAPWWRRLFPAGKSA
jgi:hypothetical protein